MQKGKITKYRPFTPIDLPNRQWPNRVIDKAPIWCSVDLRDGNQALAIPMNVEEKLELFMTLVKVGFKEIEVGFPSASDTEFAFCRKLIEENLIPDDVTIQVLVQARKHLIYKTFEAIDGAKQAIVHMYNSTNPLQRDVTFNKSEEEIKAIAVEGTKLVKKLIPTVPNTKVRFEYSPESFSDTELEYSLEVCEAVMDAWQPNVDDKIILNLPATVELAPPNVHADQIEWFCSQMKERDKAYISLHTHNDRGTGTAATELGLMAGADRVEGTLFGNGERTGNLDIIIVALNMYTQGVDPKLDFSNISEIRATYERTTRMDVHDRHPYSGNLVFTAFSGSHQDAIKKGTEKMDPTPGALYRVPYLPIDPSDIGRTYKAIIRINSQSGKGGVAYIMETEFGFEMPKKMYPDVGNVINNLADTLGKELSPTDIRDAFYKEYIDRNYPLKLNAYEVDRVRKKGKDLFTFTGTIEYKGETKEIAGEGNGPIAGFSNALDKIGLKNFRLLDFREHAISRGSDAHAACYIEIMRNFDEANFWGVSVDSNIELAGLKALISAFNRAQEHEPAKA